jgi:hypothetical protein
MVIIINKATVLAIACSLVCCVISHAVGEESAASGANLLVWHNAEKDYGWLILDRTYHLISCAVIIKDKDAIRYLSSRDATGERLLIEVELSPISVRVAASSSGYAVRISRKGSMVGLTDIKSRMIYDSESNVFFASGTVVDPSYVNEIETLPESGLTIEWMRKCVQGNKVKIAEVINSADHLKTPKAIP